VVSIPYSRFALYLVLGACAGLLAAVLPASRAARASVVAAMADALSGWRFVKNRVPPERLSA